MKLLKKLKPILSFCLALYLLSSLSYHSAAEYNLATKQQEHLLFSTAHEVKLGRSLARKIDQKFKISKDSKMQKRVEEVGKRLVEVCGRKDLSYSFTVLQNENPNAFALPGGYIYINEGLLEKTDSDDEIAAVLAHEIGHIVSRHSIKRLQASLGYNLVSLLALAATKDLHFKRGSDLAFSQIMLGYSREDELLADRLAVKYVQKSGYRPEAIISFLKKLKQIKKETPLQPLIPSYARTHPFLPERIGVVKQEIYGKIEFKDYINRQQ